MKHLNRTLPNRIIVHSANNQLSAKNSKTAIKRAREYEMMLTLQANHNQNKLRHPARKMDNSKWFFPRI